MNKKRQLDLLLINPGNHTDVYQSLGESLSAIEPPIWPALIATYIKKQNYSVKILDANAEGYGPAKTAEMVKQANPLLTAVVVYGHNPSASTQVMPGAGAICDEIKRLGLNTQVLMLGGHVAALPAQTLLEESVDFVCTGEGPHTISSLLNHLKGNQNNLEKIQGLAFVRNNEVVQTQPAPYVQMLDQDMAGMSWDLLPMDKYRSHNWQVFGALEQRTPYAALYTSLGCPYDCDFCCIQAPFKNSSQIVNSANKNTYRKWGSDAVLSQIDMLVETYGVKTFKFADEMFVLNNRHVNEICDGLIERDYDLNIWAYARVDTVKPVLLEKLRKAGFNWLCFGIESGSQSVLDSVNKGYKIDTVIETIDQVHSAGIHVIANYLFGLPEDNLHSMQETLDLACELNCAFANFYCGMAYPGSRLYDTALASRWALPKTWGGYSQHAYETLPLPTNYLSGAEVLAFRDMAFHHYFEREEYLGMILKTFGKETQKHIQSMSTHRLERKYVPQ